MDDEIQEEGQQRDDIVNDRYGGGWATGAYGVPVHLVGEEERFGERGVFFL